VFAESNYVSTMDCRAEPGETSATRERRLLGWLRAQSSVAIGYSGGVDSAYLAAVAAETIGRDRVLAIIGRSASFPEAQRQNALTTGERIGLRIVEVDTDELNDPQYASNPTNRCYFCKTELWSRLVPVAKHHGITVIADGSNADDEHEHRPGARAAREHGVASPLAAASLTKADIRERSRVRGLPTWQQPSSPCLSSRIPYGTPVTLGRLRRVEQAEAAVRALGVVGDLRVRHFGQLARVELSPRELAEWLSPERSITLRAAVLAAGYTEVEIDPRGFRSGGLNELAGIAVVPRH
jgi:pyridinium-3,5-biscarboxylic acid mononucleotide sulfurtransferase